MQTVPCHCLGRKHSYISTLRWFFFFFFNLLKCCWRQQRPAWGVSVRAHIHLHRNMAAIIYWRGRWSALTCLELHKMWACPHPQMHFMTLSMNCHSNSLIWCKATKASCCICLFNWVYERATQSAIPFIPLIRVHYICYSTNTCSFIWQVSRIFTNMCWLQFSL